MLRRHCDDVGRDYDGIEKSMLGPAGDPAADPDGFVKEMAEYAALGISLVTLMPRGDDPVRWTARVCEEVGPRLAEL